MLIFLIVLLLLLLALFLFILIADASQPKETRQANQNSNDSRIVTASSQEADRYKRRCFETYREYQCEEQKYRLYRQAFLEHGIFYYLRELFAFRTESLERKMKSEEYKKKVLDEILTPLRESVHTFLPYHNNTYHVPEQFEMFLTPEEYYEQQLSYRNASPETPASELEFWRGRLSRNDENLKKLQTDPSNAFFLKLWMSCSPLLEEAETTYREALQAAPNREAANLLTKDLTERIEEVLYRCGILVLTYDAANEAEKSRAFTVAVGQTQAPAILREKDGLVYEKGRSGH